VTAALIGIYVFDSSLRWTQWLGVAITVGVITFLPLRRRRLVRAPAAEPAVAGA
jgi:multidrug transporter EmrE-like cation transporter